MRVVILSVLLPLCAAWPCQTTEYLSSKIAACLPCSKCKKNQVTLRPCQPHKDTMCGPISDLKIDWSWLPKENKDQSHRSDEDGIRLIPDIRVDPKHHPSLGHIDISILDSYTPKVNLLESDFEDHSTDKHSHKKSKGKFQDIQFEDKKLSKKERVQHHKRKEHFQFPASDLEAEESTVRLEDYIAEVEHKNQKHKKHDSFPLHSWENDGTADMNGRRKHIRFEDEKELEKWYLRSQKQFNHRKADLMKNLKEAHISSSEEEEEGGIKLNHPIHKLDPKLYQDLLNHESHSNQTKKRRKHFPDLDLKIFQDLVKEERNRDLDFMHVLSKSGAEGLDFKSVLPTHRMFLGEPSTISEIIGQVKDSQEVMKEEIGKFGYAKEKKIVSAHPLVKKVKNDSNNPNTVPFSAAEKFVWDWQAVAFISAVTSCILFVIAAVYTILNARQWRRMKIKYDTDVEEMSSKLALMPCGLESSLAGGTTTGRYLDQLLATQNLDERKGNIYINDKLNS